MAAFLELAITADFAKTQKQLEQMANQVSHLTEFNREVGAYLVNVARNRIYTTKKDPDGKPWAKLSELTRALKGNGSILFQTGELASEIRVTDADDSGVIVEALAKNSRGEAYAGYVQMGRSKTRGRFKSDNPVPARAFLGISDTNRHKIAQMLRKHIRENLSNSDSEI